MSSFLKKRIEGMIHYCCDRCKRRIDPTQEVRYEVKVNIEPVIEPSEPHACEGDRDHLAELHESLEQLEFDDFEFADELQQDLKFDLCPQCFGQYARDPLGVEHSLHLSFSHN